MFVAVCIYIKVAFSSENVADFFVGVEVFFVEVFDHCGVSLAESLWRYFDLILSTDTIKSWQSNVPPRERETHLVTILVAPCLGNPINLGLIGNVAGIHAQRLQVIQRRRLALMRKSLISIEIVVEVNLHLVLNFVRTGSVDDVGQKGFFIGIGGADDFRCGVANFSDMIGQRNLPRKCHHLWKLMPLRYGLALPLRQELKVRTIILYV